VAKTGELMFDNYPNGGKILDVEDSNPYQSDRHTHRVTDSRTDTRTGLLTDGQTRATGY
jgi:hypothetical protein